MRRLLYLALCAAFFSISINLLAQDVLDLYPPLESTNNNAYKDADDGLTPYNTLLRNKLLGLYPNGYKGYDLTGDGYSAIHIELSGACIMSPTFDSNFINVQGNPNRFDLSYDKQCQEWDSGGTILSCDSPGCAPWEIFFTEGDTYVSCNDGNGTSDIHSAESMNRINSTIGNQITSSAPQGNSYLATLYPFPTSGECATNFLKYNGNLIDGRIYEQFRWMYESDPTLASYSESYGAPCNGFLNGGSNDVDLYETDIYTYSFDEMNFFMSCGNKSGTTGGCHNSTNVEIKTANQSGFFYGVQTGDNQSKNVITVGAQSSEDTPFTFTNGFNQSNKMNSGIGPANDGRLKPDIVGYGKWTSFTTPLLSGGSLLLREQWAKLNECDTKLKSSTIKALMLNTADYCIDPTGLASPNYVCGYGSVNFEKAADLIAQDKENNNTLILDRQILEESEIISIPIQIDGGQPLKATLAWTDPPAYFFKYSYDKAAFVEQNNNSGANDGIIDDHIQSPTLVNNLDLKLVRVSDGMVFYPWTLDHLNPNYPAQRDKEDDLNNVEQIYLDIDEFSVGEEFVLEISHKGTLRVVEEEKVEMGFEHVIIGDYQEFALVISGATVESGKEISANITTEDQYFCNGLAIPFELSAEQLDIIELGVDFSWSTSGNDVIINDNTLSPTVNPTGTTTYTFTVFNPNTGCYESDDVTLFFDETPEFTHSIIECGASSVNLLPSFISDGPYLWGDGSSSNSLAVYNSGEYTVNYTNENGCEVLESFQVVLNDFADFIEINEYVEFGAQEDFIGFTFNTSFQFDNLPQPVSWEWSNSGVLCNLENCTISPDDFTAGEVLEVIITFPNGCQIEDSFEFCPESEGKCFCVDDFDKETEEDLRIEKGEYDLWDSNDDVNNTSSVEVKGTVHVFGRLEIKDNIRFKFQEDAKIIVHPGGYLTVRNFATLTACNTTWGGIRVYSTDGHVGYGYPFPETNWLIDCPLSSSDVNPIVNGIPQVIDLNVSTPCYYIESNIGLVDVFNNATIEKADIGIQAKAGELDEPIITKQVTVIEEIPPVLSLISTNIVEGFIEFDNLPDNLVVVIIDIDSNSEGVLIITYELYEVVEEGYETEEIVDVVVEQYSRGGIIRVGDTFVGGNGLNDLYQQKFLKNYIDIDIDYTVDGQCCVYEGTYGFGHSKIKKLFSKKNSIEYSIKVKSAYSIDIMDCDFNNFENDRSLETNGVYVLDTKLNCVDNDFKNLQNGLYLSRFENVSDPSDYETFGLIYDDLAGGSLITENKMVAVDKGMYLSGCIPESEVFENIFEIRESDSFDIPEPTTVDLDLSLLTGGDNQTDPTMSDNQLIPVYGIHMVGSQGVHVYNNTFEIVSTNNLSSYSYGIVTTIKGGANAQNMQMQTNRIECNDFLGNYGDGLDIAYQSQHGDDMVDVRTNTFAKDGLSHKFTAWAVLDGPYGLDNACLGGAGQVSKLTWNRWEDYSVGTSGHKHMYIEEDAAFANSFTYWFPQASGSEFIPSSNDDSGVTTIGLISVCTESNIGPTQNCDNLGNELPASGNCDDIHAQMEFVAGEIKSLQEQLNVGYGGCEQPDFYPCIDTPWNDVAPSPSGPAKPDVTIGGPIVIGPGEGTVPVRPGRSVEGERNGRVRPTVGDSRLVACERESRLRELEIQLVILIGQYLDCLEATDAVDISIPGWKLEQQILLLETFGESNRLKVNLADAYIQDGRFEQSRQLMDAHYNGLKLWGKIALCPKRAWNEIHIQKGLDKWTWVDMPEQENEVFKQLLQHNSQVGNEARAIAAAMQGKRYLVPVKRLGLSESGPVKPFVNNKTEENQSSIGDYFYRLYPNPATDYLYLETDNKGAMNIQIHSIDGRLLANQSITSEAAINLADLPDGLLYVRIVDESRVLLHDGKIVKQ